MPRRIATSITYSGPFFTNDPAKTFGGTVRVMLKRMAEEGEADVQTQLRATDGARQPIASLGDHVSDHVIGRVVSMKGKQWFYNARISVNNSGFSKVEGTSLMAAAANVERQTHAFRRTATRLRKSRAINKAELLKGIA
jgi:hypothetical protein